MNRYLSKAATAVVLLLNSIPSQAQEAFSLKQNDTVVFYGDSITDQRLYTMLTEFYVVTRYPKMAVTFVHSGWGGDRVTGGGGGPVDLRLSRDVFAYHPTVLTIMLGMNDGGYAGHKESNDIVFYEGFHHIIDSVKKAVPGIRITAIGPSPYDDVTRPINLQPDGYNAVLVRYSDFLKKYSEEASFGYADLNTGVVAMLQKANSLDPTLTPRIIPDRVHPAMAGHLIMAEQLLKAWHARPLVSAVSIDAASGKVVDTKFAAVSDVHTGTPLTWTETEEALPLPFADMIAADNEKTIDLAIHSSDITEALNQELLRISGLAAGRYKITIDKDSVGTFTEAQLAQGINLALLQTPMSKQAMTVRDLTTKRLEVHQQRWRTYQVPMANLDLAHLDETMKALDELDNDLTAKQHQAAQPVQHTYQVSPVQ